MAKDKHELESMTKDELINYADSVDAEVQHSWLKDEIVSAILKAQRAAARQGASKNPSPKEADMDEAETKPVKVTGAVNIKGQDYKAGDEVHLTEEECSTLTELGAPIEGVEPMDDEAIQSKHEEGVEAQKQRLEDEQKARDEQDAKNKAEAKGEEYQKA